MGVFYCTREDIRSALDFAFTSKDNKRIDTAIESASRDIEENQLNRKFYPQVATKYFDWPDDLQYADPWRLYFDDLDCISLTSLTIGGATISSNDYILRPENSGPPYEWLELDRTSTAAFAGNQQQNIVGIGLWGFDNNTEVAGTLVGGINDSVTTLVCSDSSLIGVGNILYVGTERMLVTDKTMVTTSQTLQTPLTASKADVSVAVADGTAYHVGETILLDSERMLINDIAGNTLTVERAYDATVLATHTGSTVYAPRTLQVTRSALGTTGAAHLNGVNLNIQKIHPLVRELCIAEVVNTLEQRSSAYARTIGSGESIRNASGAGIADIRKRAYNALARKGRVYAV